MNPESNSLLKLRARDHEDIEVISAVLQDSIVPICDMVFQADTQTFVLVAQRLRREAGETGASERICTALTIAGVTRVQTFGINQHEGTVMLDLLAIILESDSHHLSLVFAGEARVRLGLHRWSAAIEDFGEPWPILCHPCHDSETGVGGRGNP